MTMLDDLRKRNAATLGWAVAFYDVVLVGLGLFDHALVPDSWARVALLRVLVVALTSVPALLVVRESFRRYATELATVSCVVLGSGLAGLAALVPADARLPYELAIHGATLSALLFLWPLAYPVTATTLVFWAWTGWILWLCPSDLGASLPSLAFQGWLSVLICAASVYRYRQAEAAWAERERHAADERTDAQRERDATRRRVEGLSQEIRGPLSLLLPVLKRAAAERPEGGLDSAIRHAEQVMHLVEELAYVQDLEEGRRELQAVPVDLAAIVRHTVEHFRHETTRRIVVDAAPTGDLRVKGDPAALEKVVFNLMIHLTTDVEATESLFVKVSRDERVRLELGQMVPEDAAISDWVRVFDTEPPGPSRMRPGMGLETVKRLVRQMGGEVGVSARSKLGRSVWAEFPAWLGKSAEKPVIIPFPRDLEAEDTDVQFAPDPNARGRILVVDDLEDMRTMLLDTLTAHEYQVQTTDNAEHALVLARALRPDLIVTDWMLPGMDGTALIKTLKADEQLVSIPIILLTTKSDAESRLKAAQSGADAFLVKPFNELELVSLSHNLIRLRTQERRVRELNRHLAQDVLKRYLPPALVDAILAKRVNLDQDRQSRTVTVLFADISGFTRMVAEHDPDVSAKLLDEFLSLMSDVVFGHGGTVDKFVGDAVMALFGAPTPMHREEQARRALECGIAMQAAMARLRASWRGRVKAELSLRVGIHQGQALVGNFGSARRSDYTAIGHAVNVASRIEGACEPGCVAFTERIAAAGKDLPVEPVGPVTLRGVSEPVELFQVRPEALEAAPEMGFASRRHVRVTSERLRIPVQVAIEHPGGPIRAELQDLSESGMCLVVPAAEHARIAAARRVKVKLEAGSQAVETGIHIRVRQSTRDGVRLGVEFMRWTADEALQAWVLRVLGTQYEVPTDPASR